MIGSEEDVREAIKDHDVVAVMAMIEDAYRQGYWYAAATTAPVVSKEEIRCITDEGYLDHDPRLCEGQAECRYADQRAEARADEQAQAEVEDGP